MSRLRCIAASGAVVLLLVTAVLAITTAPVDLNCPVCGSKNTLEDDMRWGSYVYRYKSKYQMVFFP